MKNLKSFLISLFLLGSGLCVGQVSSFLDAVTVSDTTVGSKTGSSLPSGLGELLEKNKVVRVDYFDVTVIYHSNGWAITFDHHKLNDLEKDHLIRFQKDYFAIVTQGDGKIIRAEQMVRKEPNSQIYFSVPLSEEEKEKIIKELSGYFPGIQK